MAPSPHLHHSPATRDKRLQGREPSSCGRDTANYESIDSWSSASGDTAEPWARKLLELGGAGAEQLARGRDCCTPGDRIQYDSITVLPPPPPPPLPRTRSFKHYRARTVHPWAGAGAGAGQGTGGRASSAPPISPLPQRRGWHSDR